MNKGLLTIVIVGIVIILGVYWYAQQNYEPVSELQQNSPAPIERVSTDDSAPVIEEELSATNIDALGAEFDGIDAEIDATLQMP